MRTLNDITFEEVAEPDLSAGYVSGPVRWASPDRYLPVDNVTKFSLSDGDYEDVMLYHAWTADEVAQRERNVQEQEQQEVVDALPDAMADLSLMVSDNVTYIADIMDAIAELSEIVSGLMEGA